MLSFGDRNPIARYQEVGAIHELSLHLGTERIQKFCLSN
jgi:hypothetical protein